ncbi:TIR domain-containing protein [Herbidospora sp. RD11066]
MPDTEYTQDFFVYHTDGDVAWGEWIASELINAGYRVIFTASDFRPGGMHVDAINRALATSRHTIFVLPATSHAEASAVYAAAYVQGLQGKEQALIPVQFDGRDIPPVLATLPVIDLRHVHDEAVARLRLLGPLAPPADFSPQTTKPSRFPDTVDQIFELRGHRPDPDFIGRDHFIRALYDDLRSGDSAIQAITGQGGLGKTQIAIEYANRHADSYDLIWWVRAEDSATLRGDYVGLASELGLPFETDDQAITALRQTLSRREKWLLIFDSAEDPGEILPLLPERFSGHVLITSRWPDWPNARTHPLEPLSVLHAVRYLVGRGVVANLDTAQLATALGCLPLALAQAASVIAGGMPAATYLILLRQKSTQLFGPGETGSHQTTIAGTSKVIVDRLAQRSPAAVTLLRFAAFLAPDAIPLDMIVPVLGMPDELFTMLEDHSRSEAARALEQHSLATIGDGVMSIHRMVQDATRSGLGEFQSLWAASALMAMNSAFPHDVDEPASWPACERLLAHALAGTEHTRRLQIRAEETTDLLDRIARYLMARRRVLPGTTDLGNRSAESESSGVGHHQPDSGPSQVNFTAHGQSQQANQVGGVQNNNFYPTWQSLTVETIGAFNAHTAAKRISQMTLDDAVPLLANLAVGTSADILNVLIALNEELAVLFLASMNRSKARELVAAVASPAAWLRHLPAAGEAMSHCEIAQGSALGARLGWLSRISMQGVEGFHQNFHHGHVYWSEGGGARAISGAIAECHATQGDLGFPVTGVEQGVLSPKGTTGRFQLFDGGAIYQVDGSPPIAVVAKMATHHLDNGGVVGRLGFPVSGEVDAAESPYGAVGRLQRFEYRQDYSSDIHGKWAEAEGRPGGGTVYRSEAHGVHSVIAAIGSRYERLGGTASWLGFPTSGETDGRESPDEPWCCFQRFEGGMIFWKKQYKAVLVRRDIADLLTEGHLRHLGFPIAVEESSTAEGGTRIQFFERGVVTVRNGQAEAHLRFS